MRRLFFVSLLFFAAGHFTSAQESQNFFYAEIGGAGPIGSLNYERQVAPETPILFRAGVGYLTSWGYSGLTLPLGLYHLTDLRRGKHLELGMTYTLTLNSKDLDRPGFFLPAIGYRKFYKGKKGFVKITFNPFVFNEDPLQVLPWGGISFGTRF